MPSEATGRWNRALLVPENAPEFVQAVTAQMLEGRGDEIPVSLMPTDGTFPSGTAVYEKRNVSDIVPVWEPDICVQCGQCSFVCPHSVIRAKYFHTAELGSTPETFKSAPINVCGFPEVGFSRSSRLSRSMIAPALISPMCAGCSFSNRCSSSRGPVPAAAKLPISSSCRSSSATG